MSVNAAIVTGSGLGAKFSKADYELAFFKTRSGLAKGSLADHRLAYLRTAAGITTGSLADAQAAFNRLALTYT